MSVRTLFIALCALALPFGMARADNWDELINRELSGNENAPTFINLVDGHNLVEGTMGFNGSAIDRDIWTFTIASGYQVTGINLVSYSAPASGINSFMAIDDAATINISDPSQHLSNGLWTEQLDPLGNTFTDMLAILQAGPAFGGTGFVGALNAGTYTFWVQETTDQIQYCIDFVVAPVPVPEPGSVVLLGAGACFCLRRRRASKVIA